MGIFDEKMKTALVIGYIYPEPNSSAAGTRMLQLIDYLCSRSFKVTFATTASPTPFMQELESRNVVTIRIELNNSSFDSFLARLNPQLVLFDRFMMEEQFGWRVHKVCPAALRILDTEDLHFLRQHRENGIKTSQPQTSIKDSPLAKREIASIFRCDLSLIISEAEMHILKEEFMVPEALLFYLPFLFEKTPTECPGFKDRKDFISIGNFKHAPNLDMVLQLKKEIWPIIHKQLPISRMLVYGAYPPQQIEELHKPGENFHIMGRAKDSAIEVKKARVMLAPIRFGAGLKGKLAEAMQCGTPSVTTHIGAEGMSGDMPWSGAIKEEPEKFANAAVQLYSQSTLWMQAQLNGYKIITGRFSKAYYYEQMNSRLQYLLATIETHRQNNFMGSMLMHHRSKSTYYLSKYIEAKMELEQLKLHIKKTTS